MPVSPWKGVFMKLMVASIAAVVFALALFARPVSAATSSKPEGISAADNQAVALAKDDVKADKKDKPKKSPKNPNDGKDDDPDDGNAGGGNDDKKLPNDGPAND